MRYFIVITVLLGIGYSQCNESNWQEYYNSEGHNMEGCNLNWAELQYANLIDANLSGAQLAQANLFGANLSCANLSGANLTYANLISTIWDECGITDNNNDGYDDASFDAGSQTGDVNLDRELNILDLVVSSNMILEGE